MILLFPLVLIVRRIIIAVALVLYPKLFLMHLLALFLINCTSIVYLIKVKPFTNPAATKVEILNEVTFVLLLYHMMCFTDMVGNLETRYIMGYSYLVFASLNILFHLVRMGYLNLKKLYKKLKKKYAKMKAKKALKISKVNQGDANLIEDSVLYEGQNPNDLLRSNSERMDRPI